MYRIHNALDLIGTLILSVLAYFVDIQGSVYIMWIAFGVDLWVGVRKSKRIDREKFSMKKFKYWLEFVFIASAVVILAYAIEQEMLWYRPFFYNGFTLIITGFTLYSIIKNGEALTHKPVFTALLEYINDKWKGWTGVDLKKLNRDEK